MQSTQTLSKIPKTRVWTEFGWSIAAQLNLSGLQKASRGPQPGSFGYSKDGVSLDGENVNPALFYLPFVDEVLWGPPAVPGAHSEVCMLQCSFWFACVRRWRTSTSWRKRNA
jgi:hypothetical protein